MTESYLENEDALRRLVAEDKENLLNAARTKKKSDDDKEDDDEEDGPIDNVRTLS